MTDNNSVEIPPVLYSNKCKHHDWQQQRGDTTSSVLRMSVCATAPLFEKVCARNSIRLPDLWTSVFMLYTSESARLSPLYLILPHPFILYIILYPLYLLWDPFITLSKYIHAWSSFEGFIETNLMMKLKFNLDFWFISYSIFFLCLASGVRHYRV
jgi:hypothetical protein